MGRSVNRSIHVAATRSHHTRGSALVGALLACACQQPSDGMDAGASGGATTSGAAQTTTSGPSTSGGATTTVEGLSDGGSSSGGAEGGDASSGISGECPDLGDSTTGEINPQVVGECDALCTHYQECGLKEHDLCQMGCVAKFGFDHDACYEAGSAARECLTAMTCDELGEYLKFNAGGPCAQFLEDQHQACTCQAQEFAVVGVDACGYTLDCPYVPFRQIYCHQGICECHVGNDIVKTCVQGDTCHVWSGIHDKAESCCCMLR